MPSNAVSIGRPQGSNNTDDVGLFHKRWVLTPSKVLGKILRTEPGDLLRYFNRSESIVERFSP